MMLCLTARPTLFEGPSSFMKLGRKVTEFQTPIHVTPSETVVKNTGLQLHFGYSLNDKENVI